ncbi:MAG: thioredoxin domain-containing protein [Candidatus Hydrogenedentes bacterium]|nr:thioredoxin domain-containing protein [Candidatus Hydrogenedentota bacterium]
MATKHETAPKHTNRLIDATSPYLLQHAHNPVDWYPWGEEAFERARNEDKPIFLSIGYAACHWCHVMEHESFEDEAVAEILNEHFISIKVDREERPDIDEIYMTAVQIMTGSGGWPMSVFLTPELKPFYGGTYFPPQDMMGRPGFKSLLRSIADAWVNRRDEVMKSAEQLTQYVRNSQDMRTGAEGDLAVELLQAAVGDLRETFDTIHGGWGGAPKFPSSPSIELLLRQHAHTGESDLLEMATQTLTEMCRGGIYDHLGGGFHRYSVDAQWLVPHFEKMLYDNAQLSEVYLDAHQATGDPLFARVAREVLDYEIRDMQDPGGAFHSTEDADSEGKEGIFYTWRHDEIIEHLGKEEGELFCAYYSVEPNGNFTSHESYHSGLNILHISKDPGAVAKDAGISRDDLEKRIAACRERLMNVRKQRVRPGLDDKILTSWNGLIIGSLAQAYSVLGDERYRDAAVRAADFVLLEMTKDGVLLRSHRNGESRIPGYLDDYAFFATGLIDLYEATFDVRWLNEADRLATGMIELFWDDANGGFYFTREGQQDVLTRTKPTYDGAEPSGNSMAAWALARLAKLTDNRDYAQKAERILRINTANMASAPRGFMKMLCVADFHLSPTREIAIAGEPDSEPVQAYLHALNGAFIPNKVVALIDPSSAEADALEKRVPLLASKSLVNGEPAVYVCENFACKQPVTTPEALMETLGVSQNAK